MNFETMNAIELTEKKIEIRNAMEKMVSTGKKEERHLTEEENAKFAELRGQYDSIVDEETRRKEADEKLAIEEEKRNKNNSNQKKMEKYSVLKEIRSILNGENQNTKITLPAFGSETRAYSVTGDSGAKGGEMVETTVEGLLMPLMANDVLGSFTWFTNLVGDVKLPSLVGNEASWAGEAVAVSESDSNVNAVTLQPKRISASIAVTRQLLSQTNANTEQVLIEMIQNAVRDKLMKTILGTGEGSTTQPQGLFYNADQISSLTFAELADIEKTVENANAVVEGYIINPNVKATARTTAKASGQGGFLFENGELLGMPTQVTSACGGVLCGALKDICIGAWSDLNLIVDPYTKASADEVVITINAFFDCKARRSNTFVAKTIA